MKTGAKHIESLRDGRQVFINGSCAGDVTTHPAFRNSVASAAALYDVQSSPQNIEAMTFTPPGSTAPTGANG